MTADPSVSSSTFDAYARAGFTADILPIIPPGATLSETSRIKPNQIGKIPGRLTRQGWVGFAEWSSHAADPDDIKRWDAWRTKANAGIGLMGRCYPAIDIDVADKELADAIELEAVFTLGAAPCRFGNGERRILVYAGAGLRKRRIAWPMDRPATGGGAQRCEDAGGIRSLAGAVEVLADGQFYVVEGIHPKTGAAYAWRDDVRPVARELVEVDAGAVARFLDGVEELLRARGLAPVRAGAALGDSVHGRDVSAGTAPSGGTEQALRLKENEDLDYDTWLTVMAAVKAAGGTKEQFLDWSGASGKDDPETTAYKWDSLKPPYRVGWDWLARWAGVNTAPMDFEPVASGEMEGPGDGEDGVAWGEDAQAQHMAHMFARYAWVEGAKRAVDTTTGALLDQEQFNARIGGKFGRLRPWQVFIDNPERRQSFQDLTFRPGQGAELKEPGLDAHALFYNTWRPAEANWPAAATEDDIEPWLKLAAVVIPKAGEREHVFDWMAYALQNPGEKINHALVIGSRAEGIGKGTLIRPLKAGVGERYVKEIGPPQLVREFNGWVEGAILAVVEEMHNFERRETMNRLKPLVAAPPHYLAVNQKNRPEYMVPNIVKMIFFTNEDDALAISGEDRRYFVTWNDEDPPPRSFYDEIIEWLDGQGARLVVRWLLGRDVSKFNAKGRAPSTEAKEAMRLASAPPLDQWIRECIEDRVGPFRSDLIIIDDVVANPPAWARASKVGFSPTRVGQALKRAKAVQVTEKVYLGRDDGSRRIWAVRRQHTHIANGRENPTNIVELWKKHRNIPIGGAEGDFGLPLEGEGA